MLYIDINEGKTLTFEVEINGCKPNEIKGAVRFEYNGVEYGFPATIEEEKITSIIKPLKKIFPDIESGTIIKARLDLNTETDFFTPWKGEIKVHSPIKVQAKIAEEKVDTGIKVKTISENSNEKKEQIIKEKLNKFTVKPKSLKPKSSKKEITREDMRKQITEDFIYKYMEKAGSRKKNIQELLYNQAVQAAGTGEPYEVLKQVIKIMGKKKITK